MIVIPAIWDILPKPNKDLHYHEGTNLRHLAIEKIVKELIVNEDYTLSGFNRTFYQIESLLFKSTDNQRTMSFKKDENGKVKYMSLGNINVFEKIE